MEPTHSQTSRNGASATSEETPPPQLAPWGSAADHVEVTDRPLPIALSVILVTHNSAGFVRRNLPELLRLLAQVERAGLGVELHVADNASTDGTCGLVRELAPGCTLLELPNNCGYGAAANEAAQACRGSWIAVLNPDVNTTALCAEDLVRALRDDMPADVGVFGPAIQQVNGEFEPSAGFDPTLCRMLAGLLRSRAARKYHRRGRHHRGNVDWVTGACIFVRREAWDAVSGFDGGFFLYYDEVDLCRRVREAGYAVRYDPSLSVEHQAPYHSRRPDPGLQQIIAASRERYFAKHRPGWERRALNLLVACRRVFGRGRRAPEGESPLVPSHP